MQKMKFDTQMPEVAIYDLGNGKQDVVILVNETVTTESQTVGMESEETQEKTVYEYDGNIFRTCKGITEEEILSDIDYYLDYEGDTEPTQEMIDYANEMIDAYTIQLIEEGAL